MAAEIHNLIVEEDQTLREIVRRLAEAYQPERIYLFGSRARGDYRPDSDYDLLIVVPDDAPPERRRDRLGCEALRDLRAAASVLVHSSSYFEARRYLKASLPGIVLREGKLLYGREGCSTMVDDAARVNDTKAWLAKADEDLKGADRAFGTPPPLLGLALFCCQQAAEKALKAFLAWHDVPFAKTHIIKELGRLCVVVDPNLSASVTRAHPLTDYAWKFRYPGGPGAPSFDETKDAIDIAGELFHAVSARLPDECRP